MNLHERADAASDAAVDIEEKLERLMGTGLNLFEVLSTGFVAVNNFALECWQAQPTRIDVEKFKADLETIFRNVVETTFMEVKN